VKSIFSEQYQLIIGSRHIFKNIKRKLKYISPFSINLRYIGCLGDRNMGDEFLYQSIQQLFPQLILTPYFTNKMALWERVLNSPFFQGSVLGGGTLIRGIHQINRSYYFDFLDAQRKYPPGIVFGAGVANPEFWCRTIGFRDLRKQWCDLLSSSLYVGVRGPISQHLLAECGYHNAEIIGDPALSLAEDSYKSKEGKKHLGLNIGVSNGNVWGDECDILEKVIQFGEIMMNRGWRISFFPVWHKDLEYIMEAVRRLRNDSLSIFTNYLSISKTLEFLTSCDVFVGEKLHSVVLAHCSRTPSIMLEYRPKCRDYMKSMDLEHLNIRTDQIDTDRLVYQVEELYERNAEMQEHIDKKVHHYKKLQHKKAKMITEMLTKNDALQEVLS
jgi:polysaccharide pyruvyl transferase WcaK-like protein